MRIFLGLALIILLSVKIKANDDVFATGLIDPSVIEYLERLNDHHTPAALSNGIPNAETCQQFFRRLSENFMQACKTLEKAQFFVSAVQPSELVGRFNKIIAQFDQTYQGQPNRQIMKQNVVTTKVKLSEYADDIAPLTLVPFINGTKFGIWTHRHRNDFGNARIGQKLADYLKHVNGWIGSIQKSISKSRGKIEHGQLKRLGTKILKSAQKFDDLVDEAVDVSSSLTEIRNAIDGVKNTKYFNDMKTNAAKILNDLNQLKLLMEKQWTDMDSIFRTQALPQLPSVNLAN